MKIIAGRFKGRNLCAFSANFIRPMTDRVKKSVFDTLYSRGYGPMEKKVLDLFSGTGNLGLEALSRGAKYLYMVDSSRKAKQIIKKNCQRFNVDCSVIKIYQKDVFSFLKSYEQTPFDLIFADPPFKKHYGTRILQNLLNSKTISKNTILVLETSKKEEVIIKKPCTLMGEKLFGDKKVFFFNF